MSPDTDATQSKSGLGAGVVGTCSGLGVLLVFILQNRQPVTLQFLVWDFTWPVWLYTIVVAVFGAMVWFGLGVMRRRRRRKARRA
ncbi:lipopolysaccharide assembly protein LapA domain-containing protein [Pengzhenrongella phosphoraccumulans]|uniref:lipopolysaccharide assembly protein LapA domain-containing protein n=1 Tax=Pengzhenrongella phosphoraccumulans TaxID=3114394 RepID=UPI00389059A0